MALGPLGDCVYYWMSRLQERENKQKNELKGVIYSRRPDGRVDGNMEEQSTSIAYNHGPMHKFEEGYFGYWSGIIREGCEASYEKGG